MQQLLLDVFTPPAPSLSNFVVGDNAELVLQLNQMVQASSQENSLYICGPTGSGKSHLLKALANAFNVPVLSGKNRLVWRGQSDVLILDDVQYLTDYSQVQLFNAFNESRQSGHPRHIVVSGHVPTSQLQLREDLTSRLAWGLSYRIAQLSDDQKQTALNNTAKARGLNLAHEVITFVLTHFQRDMGSLSAVLDGIDQFSLEQQKPVSLHLLRQWMRRREALLIKNHNDVNH